MKGKNNNILKIITLFLCLCKSGQITFIPVINKIEVKILLLYTLYLPLQKDFLVVFSKTHEIELEGISNISNSWLRKSGA